MKIKNKAVRIVVAGLLGGLIMFIWSAVSHTMTPFGEAGISKLSDEVSIRRNLQGAIGDHSGLYMFPAMDHRGTLEPPPGPSGVIMYHFNRSLSLSPWTVILELISELAQGVVAAMLLSATGMIGYTARVGFVALIGVPVALATNLTYWIWFGFPSSYTASQIFITWGGYLVAGLVIAGVERTPAPIAAAARPS